MPVNIASARSFWDTKFLSRPTSFDNSSRAKAESVKNCVVEFVLNPIGKGLR